MKRRSASIRIPCRARPCSLALAVAGCFAIAPAFALPTGAQVVAGSAQISQKGNVLQVTNTPGTIINWNAFSIAPLETTQFFQQSALSSVLNRVVGSDASQILGALQSNGRVFLINPNGILFGAGARVDVNGLIASTLRISDKDFLAGRLNFEAGVLAGGIKNEGTITTPTGGTVYLVAPDIENTGIIRSPQGEVMLAAGRQIQLVESGRPDIQIVISAPTDKAVNLGQILVEGGRANLFGTLLQQKGIVSADAVETDAAGRIVFRSTRRTELAVGSVTSANGSRRGGEVLIQGGDELVVKGEISTRASDPSGKGGFIDTSAHWLDINDATIKQGKGGTWLIDPSDIVITTTADSGMISSGSSYGGSSASTIINTGTITGALANGNVVVDTALAGSYGGTPSLGGTITVSSPLAWSNASELKLSATNAISLNAAVNGGASGTLSLNAGAGGITNNSGAGLITANKLEIQSAGAVDIIGNNQVGTLAANLTTGALNFENQAAGGLTVGIAGSTTGVSAPGNITLRQYQNGGSNPGIAVNENVASSGGDVSIMVSSGTGGLAVASGKTVSGTNVSLLASGGGVTVNGSVTGSGSVSLDNFGGSVSTGASGLLTAPTFYLQADASYGGLIGSSGSPLKTSSPGGTGNAAFHIGSAGAGDVYIDHAGDATLSGVYLNTNAAVGISATGDLTNSVAINTGTSALTFKSGGTLTIPYPLSGQSVSLIADTDNSGAGAINVSGAITANGGSILMAGGSSGTSYAVGTGANIAGVAIDSNVTASSGSITIKGKGISGVAQADGVRINSGRTLSAQSIAITGLGGNGGSGSTYNDGVEVLGTLVASGGALALTGTAGIGVDYNSGVNLSGASVTNSGSITITGTGAGTGIGNSGVTLSGAATVSASGAGTISITGYGGPSNSSPGVNLMSASSVSTVNGALSIDGSASNTGTGGMDGVRLQGSATPGASPTAVTSSGTGTITLRGVAGTGGGNGIYTYGSVYGATVSSSSSDITLSAGGSNGDQLYLGANTAIYGGTGSTLAIQSTNNASNIDLGSGGTGALILDSTEAGLLSGFGTWRIGTAAGTNRLTVNNPLNAGTAKLHLKAGSGGVDEAVAGSITATDLAVTSTGPVNLDTGTNHITNLAASLTGSTANYFYFHDADGINVDQVDSVTGITISPIAGSYVSGSSDGVISLRSSGGNITQSAAGALNGAAVYAATSSGYVALNTAGNATGVIAGTSATDYFSYKSASPIKVTNVASHVGIGAATSVTLETTGGISTSGASITAPAITLTAGDGINVAASNATTITATNGSVGTPATKGVSIASTSAAYGGLSVQVDQYASPLSSPLTDISVTHNGAITTAGLGIRSQNATATDGGSIYVASTGPNSSNASKIYATNAIPIKTLGAGRIILEADELALVGGVGAVSTDASSGVVHLRPYAKTSPSWQIVGSPYTCGTLPCYTSADLGNISANTLYIGATDGSVTGDLSISGAVTFTSAMTGIGTGGYISKNNAGVITANTLALYGGGNIYLGEPTQVPNSVNQLAAYSLNGLYLSFKNDKTLTVPATITDPLSTYTVGVGAPNGSVSLTTPSGGDIFVAGNIGAKTTSGGSVSLSAAGGAVRSSGGTVTAYGVNISASSGIGVDGSLLTQASVLSATNSGANTNIMIANTGPVQIATATQPSASTGSISISNTGSATIGSVQSYGGAIYLDATGTMTVGTGGAVVSNTGNIVIDAPSFVNSSGSATPFTTSAPGRWLIYAAAPANVTKGGMTSNFRHYSATSSTYGTPAESGNGFIYASSAGALGVSTSLVSGTASHTFGGSPTAVLAYGPLTGFADSEDTAANIGLSGTATFSPTLSSAMAAGSYNILYSTGLSSSLGYTFVAGTGLAYTVNPVVLSAITGSLTGTVSKVYDGTILATLAPGNFLLTGFVGTDGATVTATTGSYGSKNAGTNIPVTANLSTANFTPLGSTNLSNYTLPTTITGAVGTITPAPLAITATADAKTYDGTTLSTRLPTAGALVGGDTFSALSQAFDSRNAGTRTLIPTAVINDGNGGGNYTVTAVTANGSISKALLAIAAIADTKVYDGTTQSAVASTISGTTGLGDTITATQVFDSRNAGARTLIPVPAINDGNNGNNYSLTLANAVGTIEKAPLTVTTSDVIKTYDGTTAATGVATPTNGTRLFATDSLTGGTFAYQGTGVGQRNKTVNVSGVSVQDGNGGGNYLVAYADNTTSTIDPRALTVSIGNVSMNEGQPVPSPSYTITGGSLASGDSLTGSPAVSGTTSLTVGTYPIGLGTLSGGANYSLSAMPGTLTVNPAAVSSSAQLTSLIESSGGSDSTAQAAITQIQQSQQQVTQTTQVTNTQPQVLTASNSFSTTSSGSGGTSSASGGGTSTSGTGSSTTSSSTGESSGQGTPPAKDKAEGDKDEKRTTQTAQAPTTNKTESRNAPRYCN